MEEEIRIQPRKMTISSIFLVPTMGIERQKLNKNGFVNSYLFCDIIPIDFDNYCLYLLFKIGENNSSFEEFLVFLKQNIQGEIIYEYETVDNFFIIVCKLDEVLNEDIEKILNGNYSKISDKLLNRIPKFINIDTRFGKTKEYSFAYMIYKKNKILKEMWEKILDIKLDEDSEVWDKKTIEDETLSFQKIAEMEEYLKTLKIQKNEK
jgi:hypothetical protein